MLRPLLLVAVLLASIAAAAAPAYTAEPATAPMSDKLVLRDTVWKRSGGAFLASGSGSRPAVVCALLAKEVGQLKSFSIGGAPISPQDLEKCNARAK